MPTIEMPSKPAGNVATPSPGRITLFADTSNNDKPSVKLDTGEVIDLTSTIIQAALGVAYDNGDSGLTATNVKEAIDEIVALPPAPPVLPYKSFVAIMSQVNAFPSPLLPTLSILQDDMVDPIVVTELSGGRYQLTSTDFILAKTHINGSIDVTGGNGNATMIPLTDNVGAVGYVQVILLSASVIQITCWNALFDQVDMFDLIGNGKWNIPEIRVYP